MNIIIWHSSENDFSPDWSFLDILPWCSLQKDPNKNPFYKNPWLKPDRIKVSAHNPTYFTLTRSKLFKFITLVLLISLRYHTKMLFFKKIDLQYLKYYFSADPETWSCKHVKEWLLWLTNHYRLCDEALITTYSQYTGREILKMGRRLFRDLYSSQYSILGSFWDHLTVLQQGKKICCEKFWECHRYLILFCHKTFMEGGWSHKFVFYLINR